MHDLEGMPLHPILFAPLIALLTMATVYGDTRRRSLPLRTRLGWTVGVGVFSLGGSITVFMHASMFYRQYLLLLGRPLVVRSPFELLTWLLSVGTASSAVLVLIYVVGSRIGVDRAT